MNVDRPVGNSTTLATVGRRRLVAHTIKGRCLTSTCGHDPSPEPHCKHRPGPPRWLSRPSTQGGALGSPPPSSLV